jgi:membrane dipeptidase
MRDDRSPPRHSLIAWPDLACGRADRLNGETVEISGWMLPGEAGDAHDYFLLVPDQACCLGCRPADPLACVEVYAAAPITMRGRRLRLAGQWRRLADGDPAGWMFQLRHARLVEVESASVSRRDLLTAGALIGLGACSTATTAADLDAAKAAIASTITVDLHSHAGRILGVRRVRERAYFSPVWVPMTSGGMAAICLAMVADTPTTEVSPDQRIYAFRKPDPGELYAWGRASFGRMHDLVRVQRLNVVTNAATLWEARDKGPSVIISAEGADFLEGVADRVDEAFHEYKLRHLQLTHYRVNELGDIQTEAPVHGGLTDFGAEVIRRCNQLGIVVDIAHGPIDLVKRAAEVSTKPLVLSHTSLSRQPGPRSRTISAEHAKLVASTGGVIGVWPPDTIFKTKDAFVTGIKRMVDAAGIDHVGLGSDMLGLLSPSMFASYDELPDLAARLLGAGFRADETAKILGGNYARVFAQTTG